MKNKQRKEKVLTLRENDIIFQYCLYSYGYI